MKKEKAYLANQFGFSTTGNFILDKLIRPKLEKTGIIILDPFAECAKELDFDHLATLKTHEEVTKYWKNFSLKIAPINNDLMRQADCMLAILDGGHVVDDGVASEIGYFTGIKKGPIFALRSDFRLCENMASTINAQILGYILESKGFLADGPDALNAWFKKIQEWQREKK